MLTQALPQLPAVPCAQQTLFEPELLGLGATQLLLVHWLEFWHCEPFGVMPAQAPLVQPWPVGQVLPQLPQLLLSVCRFLQTPRQQPPPAPQPLPQLPQLLASDTRFTQVPLQLVVVPAVGQQMLPVPGVLPAPAAAQVPLTQLPGRVQGLPLLTVPAQVPFTQDWPG